MRTPAVISPWLSDSELELWVKRAPNKAAYQRRLAIWITRVGRLHAAQVARLLGTSPQGIWKWVGEYNMYGPDGLHRSGRGGRRRSYVTRQEEKSFLLDFLSAPREINHPLDVRRLQEALSGALERSVSMGYAYKLLHRNAPTIVFKSSKGRWLSGAKTRSSSSIAPLN